MPIPAFSSDVSARAFADTLPSQAFDSEPLEVDSAFEAVDYGLPADRAARLAARRLFVEMKQVFLRAVTPLRDRKGDWLRLQVRQSQEPLDLWLLRGPVLSALRGDDARSLGMRAELYRSLDQLMDHVQTRAPDQLDADLPQSWAFSSSVNTALQAWR